MSIKVRGASKVQVIFELKHKVGVALNKVADRDTQQIGLEELEKTVQSLTPDKISPFLSCILDTDSEKKSAVRKECIRLMGTLATYHEGIISPYFTKMIASIVKRLKDPDSVVREACVETMGVLASKADQQLFVVLVKPLFEALGEQNKQMQLGSALCLARVIDCAQYPSVSILQRMLTRTTKLLNNPHFMAKPAVIELNTSIIQAGGAATKTVLTAAMTTIQDALRNSDWTTRKAASAALGTIASEGGSYLDSLKASCIQSLESCRFDKVKPVRDSVLLALQQWKNLPGHDTHEPSEAGSSIKENFYTADYSDHSNNCDTGKKDVALKKVVMESVKRRIPLSANKASQNYVEVPHHSKQDDWNVEIAVPKGRNVTLSNIYNEESADSCVTSTFQMIKTDVAAHGRRHNDIRRGEKQETSSVSNLVNDIDDIKSVTISHDCFQEGSLLKEMRRSQRFEAEEMSSEEQIYQAKLRDHKSLDSTVTDSCPQTINSCCSQMANEMVCIRKQLTEIESKQINLIDHLQVFSTGLMDNLSVLQSKVSSLEYVVDKIAQGLIPMGNSFDSVSSKLKKNPSVSSPRLSSVDNRNRQSSLLSGKNSAIWEKNKLGTSRSINSARMSVESCQISSARKKDVVLTPVSSASIQQKKVSSGMWKCVKGLLSEGKLDSAYMEALAYGNDLVFVELLNRTGPVLDSLSHDTGNEILRTLAFYLVEQRFIGSVIPWLQQVVELSTEQGSNYLVPYAKVRCELLSATQEALKMDLFNPTERRLVAQLAMRLHELWGKKLVSK